MCEYAKEAPIHEQYKVVRPAGVLTLDFMLGSEEVNLRNKCLLFKAPMYFCYSSPNVLLPSDTQLPKSSHTSPNISSYHILFLLYPSLLLQFLHLEVFLGKTQRHLPHLPALSPFMIISNISKYI